LIDTALSLSEQFLEFTKTKGICTPRGLTEHLIGSLDIVSGPVQPGDKHPHATFA
jgi:hypothetical protein